MEQPNNQSYIFEIIKIALPVFISLLKSRLRAQKQDETVVYEAIQRHLVETLNWSRKLQFFGMSTPDYTEEATIALSISNEPRRFRSVRNNKIINETDLISETTNVILLGEPGAGKTTTIKRIINNMVVEAPNSPDDHYKFPILIRLGYLNDKESLLTKLIEIFGLKVEAFDIWVRVPSVDKFGNVSYIDEKQTEMRIGGEKIEVVISNLLNEGHVLVLLDGLDEIRPPNRDNITSEIINLSHKLTTSKIIISCRSGDYSRTLEGFSVHELCSLTEEQIQFIKDIWLGKDDKSFLEQLHKLPYKDVADRPLLLTQLLFLYKIKGYFPEQPSQVYNKLVNLLLEQWDVERGIRRISKYSGFDPTQKAEFLYALSYQLTYILQKTRFTENDLIEAYWTIHERYQLPRDQAQQVAREIQTHNGIITIGPNDVYEFCHLSLQEYLCAQYIVRLPMERINTKYLSTYSAPLAVAVALSSVPSFWFSSLIMKFGNIKYFNAIAMNSFLSRILAERPNFEVDESIGFAILSLYKQFGNDNSINQRLSLMLKNKTVLTSLKHCLRWYKFKNATQNSVFIEVVLDKTIERAYSFDIPTEGRFPRALLSSIKKMSK
ncbi:MAG: NACHT domain-containing protein [Dehalococcoidales bacterium]|nr:NACHT domain-containing protein [Dehalococcoidales bacterium]